MSMGTKRIGREMRISVTGRPIRPKDKVQWRPTDEGYLPPLLPQASESVCHSFTYY